MFHLILLHKNYITHYVYVEVPLYFMLNLNKHVRFMNKSAFIYFNRTKSFKSFTFIKAGRAIRARRGGVCVCVGGFFFQFFVIVFQIVDHSFKTFSTGSTENDSKCCSSYFRPCRWCLKFTKNGEEETEHAHKACVLITNRQ